MRLLLLCLCLLWPFAVVAQDENSDRGYIQGLLEDALSNDNMTVRLEGFRGALSSRATVDRITIADPQGVWLEAANVALQWNRSDLLRGRVEIQEISMETLSLPRLPSAPSETPAPEARSAFALPDLPVALILEQLQVDTVELGEAVIGEAAQLRVTGSASLQGGEGQAELNIERLDRGGQIALTGSYSNGTRVLGLDLSVQEPEGGLAVSLLGVPGEPSLALTLQGNAPIDDFEAELTLATDGTERLAGTVILRADGNEDTRRFRMDVAGDVASLVAPQYREFLGDSVSMTAEVLQQADGATELSELELSAEALRLTGYARIGADGWPERLDLQGGITPPQGERVVLPIPGAETSVAGVTLEATFNAEEGNGWSLQTVVEGFDREGLGTIDRLSLSGNGEIARDETRVTGTVRLGVSDLGLDDPALAQAVGPALNGTLDFGWQPSSPLLITDLDLSGADYGLDGEVSVSALDALNPVISPDVRLRADNLSRFGALAGLDLDGSAEVRISGAVLPSSGGFDIALNGTTRNLATGIAQADPLLAGSGSIRVEARRDETGLFADVLRIATAAAQINGTAQLASGTGQADLDIVLNDTALLLPGVEGQSDIAVTAVQGPQGWDIDLNGTIPDVAQVQFDGTVDPEAQNGPSIIGALEAQVSRLSPFSELAGRDLSGAANLSVNGQGVVGAQTFEATVEARTTNVSVSIDAVDALLDGVSDLSFTARRGIDKRFELQDLKYDGLGTIRLDGTVTGSSLEDAEVDGKLLVDVPNLAPLSGVAGRQMSGSVLANVDATGQVMQGPLTLRGNARTQDVVTGLDRFDPLLTGRSDLQFDARRNAEGLYTLSAFTYRGIGTITLDGTVTGTSLEDAAIDGRVQADLPRLAPLSGLAGREMSGAVIADVTASGTIMSGPLEVSGTASTRDVVLSLPSVDPLLAGTSSLRFAAERDAEGRYTLSDLNYDGVGTVTLDGTVSGSSLDDAAIDGRVQADLPRLAPLSGLAGRQLSGAVVADVRASGTLMSGPLDLSADVQARDVALSIPAVDPLLRGTTTLNVTASRDASDVITVSSLSLDGAANLRFSGTVAGLMDDGQLRVDGRAQGSMPNLSALAGLTGQALRGSVTFDTDIALVQPDGPVDVTGTVTAQGLGIGNPTLDPFLAGTTRADIDIQRTAGGALRIERLVVDGSSIDGSVSGSLSGQAADLRLDVSVAGLERLVPELPGTGTVSGTVRHSGGPWQVDLNGTGPGGVGARVSGTAAQDFSTVNLNLNGTAPLGLANARLAPQSITGVLNFEVAVNGRPSLAAISGRVSTTGARLAVPSLDISLDGIAGGVGLNGGRAELDLTGNISTGGQVRITGPITLAAPYNAQLVATLVDAGLRRADVFETTADGRITVDGPLTGGARIAGRIDLGQVEVRIPNIGPSYQALDGLKHVNMPSDVALTLKFAGLGPKVQAAQGGDGGARAAYPIDLTVNAPNRIFVRGRGLDAELGGSLRLTGTTADIVPVGQFDLVRGRLDLLGRRLDLTVGEVALRGSFDPYIRFAAVSRVEDTEITISIEGPATSPELTVTSSPDLPQDEALAFFLFGQSVTNLSPLQAVQLAAAIRTLSGQGGLGLTNELRNGLGVDNLDIGTSEDGTAEARVGKYISENIYTDVVVGSDGTSEINLNLNVTDSVTVRGRVGSDGTSGLGVYFEKDY